MAVRSIEIVTAEIHTIRDNVAKVFMDGVVQIGRRLEEAKQLVPQGEWLAYLDKELGYKPSAPRRTTCALRASSGTGRSALRGKTPGDFFGHLGYSQLLPLLGLPEEEREQLAEEHDLAGMSSREIQALVRERDEAKASADKLESALAGARQWTGRRCRASMDTAQADRAQQTDPGAGAGRAGFAKANAQTAAESAAAGWTRSAEQADHAPGADRGGARGPAG